MKKCCAFNKAKKIYLYSMRFLNNKLKNEYNHNSKEKKYCKTQPAWYDSDAGCILSTLILINILGANIVNGEHFIWQIN